MTAERTTRRIAPQAPCSGGLRPPLGNDSALIETPLQLKTSLSLRAGCRHPPSAFLNSPHFVDYVKTSGKAAKADNYPLTDLGAFRIMRVLWISSDRYLLLPQSGIVSILAERRSARWAWNLPLRLFLTDLSTLFFSPAHFFSHIRKSNL